MLAIKSLERLQSKDGAAQQSLRMGRLIGRDKSLPAGAAYNISEVVNNEVDLGVALNNAAQKAVHSGNYFSNNIRDFVQEVDK